MDQKSIYQGILKTDFRINNQPISALKVLKEVYWMWIRHSIRYLTKMGGFKEQSAIENCRHFLLICSSVNVFHPMKESTLNEVKPLKK